MVPDDFIGVEYCTPDVRFARVENVETREKRFLFFSWTRFHVTFVDVSTSNLANLKDPNEAKYSAKIRPSTMDKILKERGLKRASDLVGREEEILMIGDGRCYLSS